MTKEALRLALEALVLNNAEWKHLADSGDSGYWSAEDQNHYKQTEQAIAAVQRALANEALEKMAENARELGLDYEPEPVPVAVVRWNDIGHISWRTHVMLSDDTPLYTTPPQRTWVNATTWRGLTDEEMQSIAFESADALSAVFVAEAKLKAKNSL